MAKKTQQQQGWSVTTVTVCVAIVVAMLTWAAAASAYVTDRFYAEVAAAEAAGEDRPDNQMFDRPRGRRTAGVVFAIKIVWEFFKNAVVEIPHAPQVMLHVLTQRMVIPIGFVMVELLVIGGGIGLKTMERSMEQPSAAKRKPKVAAIRVPKPTDD